jgi:transposase
MTKGVTGDARRGIAPQPSVPPPLVAPIAFRVLRSRTVPRMRRFPRGGGRGTPRQAGGRLPAATRWQRPRQNPLAKAHPPRITQVRGHSLLERISQPEVAWHHGAMDIPRLAGALWEVVAPILPPRPARPKGGRPFADDRAALCGILFVLWTGAPWAAVPRGPGTASPATCWRRLRDWQATGTWDRLHRALLDRLGAADRIAWERACLDSASVPAKRGATAPAATRPTAAGRAASCTS